MNPLKKISFNSPVILIFTISSLVVLGLSAITNGASNTLLFSVYGHSWKNPLGYIRLFGHVLGHANIEHYTSNFLLILMVGPMLEEKYGSKILAGMIAVTALITGVISAVFNPNAALLGASGVVFMMILLSSFARAKSGTIPVTLILAVIIYIGKEVISGTAGVIGLTTSNISHATHVIGGICGAVFGFIVNRKNN